MILIGLIGRVAGGRNLGLSTAVSGLAGALVSFMVMVGAVLVFDQAWFESGLNYDTYRTTTQRAGLAFRTAPGVTVSRVEPDQADSPVGQDLQATRTPGLRLFSEPDVIAVRHWLGASLHTGSLATDTAVLDALTASALGVSVGDRISIVDIESDEPSSCVLEVSGITRSARADPRIDDEIADGMLLISDQLCASTISARLEDYGDRWNCYDSGGETHWQVLAAKLPAESVLGVGLWVTCFGGLLWSVATWRTASHLRRQVSPAALSLVHIGAGPGRVRLVLRGWLMVCTGAGALIAGLLATAAAHLIVKEHLQPALITVTMLLLGCVAALMQTLATRRWPTGEDPL